MMANDLASALSMEVRDTQACRKDFDFTVPAATIARESERAVRDVAQSVNIPGFRKGKAPAALLKSRYADEINQELKRRIVYAAFDKIGEDKSLDVVSCGMENEPEIVPGEDFKFTLNADIAPEFELGEYLKLKIDVAPVEIADETVEERVKFYRSMYANYADVEGAAQADDMLKVDYSCGFELPEDASPTLKRQVAAENGYIWLSEPEIIPGSIAALTGVKAGDEKTFEATYPADFRESALAGKTLKYTVKVIGVQRKQDLTDAELCEKTRTPSLDEFKKMIRLSLENEAKGKRQAEVLEKTYEALSASIADFEVPPGVLETEINREVRKLANEIVKSEADVEEFKAKTEEHRATAREAALKALRKTFILRKIAKAEKIEISRADVDGQLRAMSRYYGRNENELRSMLEKTGGMDELQLDILNAKVLDFLAAKAEEAGKK